MIRPKVFIVQEPTPRKRDGWVPDLSAAAVHGTVEFLFPAGYQIFAKPKEAWKLLDEKLQDFDPERDFLCSTNSGDPAGTWIVASYITEEYGPSQRWLYWTRGRALDGTPSPTSGYYYPINIGPGEENIEK